MPAPAATAATVGRRRPDGGASRACARSARPTSRSTGGFWADRAADEPRADDPGRVRAARRAPATSQNFAARRPARRGTATGRSGSCSTSRSRSSTPTSTSGSRRVGWELGRGRGRRHRRDGRRGDRPRRGRPATRRLPQHASSRSSLPASRVPRTSQWGHELYCVGHLVQAAIAWHRALGDDRLLVVAERAVGLDRARARPGRPGRRSTAIPRSRWRSSSCTGRPGERRYLDLAARVHRPARPRAASGRAGSGRRTGRTTCRSARPRRSPATRSASCTWTAARSTSRSSRRPGAARRRPAPLARHGRDADRT